MFTVLLLRHGQSTWNVAGRWQGQEDPPLTVHGEAQAVAAASAIRDRQVLDPLPSTVWSSDLQRAVRTADVMADAWGGASVKVLPDLRERHAGPWEGCTRADIEEGWPGFIESGERPEGFESEESLSGRGLAALEAIYAGSAGLGGGGGGPAVGITHSGMLFSLERRLDAWRGRLPNLGGLWLVRGDLGDWSVGDRVDLIDEVTGAGIIE